MANTTTTPNMQLVLPVVGTEIGPDWANEIIAALNKIDLHDHTSGSGAQVSLASLAVNDDFDLNQYAIYNIADLQFYVNPTLPSTNGVIYRYGDDLYYNDGAGNKIQITSNGTLNMAATGTITGDYGQAGVTAELHYSNAAPPTYAFSSSAGVYAIINSGDVGIFDTTVVGGNGVTLKAISHLASSFSITLPVALPISTLPLQMSSTGQLLTGQITTAQITLLAVDTPQINNAAITTPKLAANAVTGVNILNSTVTLDKLVSLNQTSGSTNNVTDSAGSSQQIATANITYQTSNRPKLINIIIPSAVCYSAAGVNGSSHQITIYRGPTLLKTINLPIWNEGMSILCIDSCAAGAYTYTMYHVAAGDCFSSTIPFGTFCISEI
jgi:hypothetical protein